MAGRDGLLVVDTAALAAFNMVEEVMCATLHTHTLVKRGELVAATRAIPLVMKRVPIDRATIARQNGPVRPADQLFFPSSDPTYAFEIRSREYKLYN